MGTPTNVKELFAPLGERLYDYYESGNYVHQATVEYMIEFDGPQYYSGYNIMSKIGKGVDVFDNAEVYEKASFYHQRVKDMIENLDYTLYERSVYVNMDVEDEITPVTGKRKEELKKIHSEELHTYLNGLEAIMKPRESAKKMEVKKEVATTTSTENVINLSDSFSVKELQIYKKAKLTLSQSALFLYYLRYSEIIPSYSDSSLGKIAEFFIARNEKTIRDGLSKIHSLKQNKKDLEFLKVELQSLLDTINEDLKEAR